VHARIVTADFRIVRLIEIFLKNRFRRFYIKMKLFQSQQVSVPGTKNKIFNKINTLSVGGIKTFEPYENIKRLSKSRETVPLQEARERERERWLLVGC
jgi:hypothetical protein